MASGDIYQIIDTATFQGQKNINVYFYRFDSLASAPDAADVADMYQAELLPLVLGIQNAQVLHEQIDVNNLFNPSDRVSVSISEPGTGAISSVDLLPVFNAINFTLGQDNGSIRNGSKRYSGMAESWQTSGVVTDTSVLTWLTNLGIALTTPWQIGIIDSMFPVVVKRILDGGNYRLPETSGEAVFGGIVDAVFDLLITSQVSRKIGHGE